MAKGGDGCLLVLGWTALCMGAVWLVADGWVSGSVLWLAVLGGLAAVELWKGWKRRRPPRGAGADDDGR